MPPKKGSVFQLMVTTGILSVYVLGAVIPSWRILAGVFAVLPVLTFISVFFLKESPLYLISKGKEDKAAASLKFYRGIVITVFIIIAAIILLHRILYSKKCINVTIMDRKYYLFQKKKSYLLQDLY